MPFLFPNKVLTEGMRSAVSCQILEGNLPIKFHWEKNGRQLYGADSSYNGEKRKNLMPYHSSHHGGGKSSNSIQMFEKRKVFVVFLVGSYTLQKVVPSCKNINKKLFVISSFCLLP